MSFLDIFDNDRALLWLSGFNACSLAHNLSEANWWWSAANAFVVLAGALAWRDLGRIIRRVTP